MKRIYHKSLSEVANKSSQLHDILAKAKLLEQLNKALPAALPVELQSHCQVVNIRDQQLILAADTSSWANQLRYQRTSVIEVFKSILPSVTDLKIIVQPLDPIAQPVSKPRLKLSATAAKQLKSTAATIKNKKLRQAMEKLAENNK